MKHFFLAVLILVSTNLVAQNYEAKIDSLIQAYVKLNKFNGVALITKNGKKIFENTYGYSNKYKNILHTKDNIFLIGSLTKSFTASIIMKLVDEKKLSLDDTVTKFLPEYKIANHVTVKHLLSHTAGIYEIFRNPNYFKQAYDSKKFSTAEKLSFFNTQPLDFVPGSQFSYSNSGYILLGVIIEIITKDSYENALKRYILNPMKMTHTGYDYGQLKNEKQKVVGYSYLSKTRQLESKLWNPDLLFSSGALYSTTADIYKFYKGLTTYQLISKENLSAATSPYIGGYGYGWFIDSIANDKIINHGGNIDGFTSYLLFHPKTDICIILLNNITSSTLETIGNSIYKILTDKPYNLPKPKKEIQLNVDELTKYVGLYKVSEDYMMRVTVEKENLFLQINKEEKMKLSAESTKYFFIKDEDISLEFISKDGQIVELKLKQGLSTKYGEKEVSIH